MTPDAPRPHLDDAVETLRAPTRGAEPWVSVTFEVGDVVTVLDGLADAQAEIARLRAAVSELHQEYPEGQTCYDCGVPVPCWTVRVLAAAPAPAEDEWSQELYEAEIARLRRLAAPAPGSLLAERDAEIARLTGEVARLRAVEFAARAAVDGWNDGLWGTGPTGSDAMRVLYAALAAAPDPAEDECGAGHDPERICCAHARDVERLRVDRELHQDRADRLAVELMRLRDQIGEVIAADRRFENAPAPAREQADPADERGGALVGSRVVLRHGVDRGDERHGRAVGYYDHPTYLVNLDNGEQIAWSERLTEREGGGQR